MLLAYLDLTDRTKCFICGLSLYLTNIVDLIVLRSQFHPHRISGAGSITLLLRVQEMYIHVYSSIKMDYKVRLFLKAEELNS